MDLWSTLFAPCIGGIFGYCFQQIWPCLSERVIHMWEVKENLVKLKKVWDVLIRKRNNVLKRIEAGKQKDELPRDVVAEWLIEVETTETKVNRLLTDASDRDNTDQVVSSTDGLLVHQRLPTSGCCWSRDNLSNCCLGQEVFEMLSEVRRLTSSGREFEVVTEAPPPPVAEIIEEINTNSFMIGAREIKIYHSDRPKNWTWSSIQEAPNQAAIEIATMERVYNMDISGRYSTTKLIPEKKYKVVFVVRLKGTAVGWNKPVNLSLKISMRDQIETLPEQTSYLDYIGEEWVDVEVGDFVAPPKNAPATITFGMYQHDTSVKKTGLVVKGVAIRPMD